MTGRGFSLLVLMLALCFPAFAQYPQPPLEEYGNLPLVSSAEISPDGTKVAAIANVNGSPRMIVFEIGAGISKQVGLGDIKARSVSFYDNDHVILDVSETTRTRGFRGEYEYNAAFSFNLANDKIQLLLKGTKDIFPAQSGLGRIIGRGKRQNEVLMPAYIGSPYEDPAKHLMRVNLDNGKGRILKRGTTDTIDWFADGEGNAIVRERYNNRTNKYKIQYYDGSWTTIYEKESPLIPLTIFGLTPDKTGLVFLQIANDEAGYDRIMKMSFDGEISGPIIAGRDREIGRFYFTSDRVLLGVRYSGISPEYQFLDVDLQRSVDSVTKQLPNATVYLDSWSDDRSRLLYHVFEPAVGDVWLVHNAETDGLLMITNTRPDIPVAAMGVMMSIEYPARDGLTIPAIVTLPPGTEAEDAANLPLIALPHGGPSAHDSFDFDWMAQYFANRGYAVFQPNFRGSTGFGETFKDAGRGEWGGKMQDDITDGIEALAGAGMIDPDRVCIVGASYGGYAALAGATFTPELYKCVIAIAPVSDLNLMLRTTKRESGRHHWVIDYWENLMADGDARRAKLRAISPANFAENVQAPILLLHGDDDTVVSIDQSRRMQRALNSAGKDVTFVKLRGEDHWLSVATTRLQLLQEMDAFIAEHLPVDVEPTVN